jgi:hypothetical protein
MGICDICHGICVKINDINDYEKCSTCGHEIHIGPLIEKFIINDGLSFGAVTKVDSLEKFKKKIVKICVKDYNFLLDVGSASGKFIYNHRGVFKNLAGIEVTPECITFAREKLGLNIIKNISELGDVRLSLVTFWHTLEHIPFSELREIFIFMNNHSTNLTRTVISVPNADSLLYKWSGSKFAYYDNISHIRQFTPRSLDLLLKEFDFVKEREFFSFPYSFFCYLQTMLNYANLNHNFLYFFLKRKNRFGLDKLKILFLFVYNLVLAGILFIPALIGSLYDAVLKNKAVVSTICYRFKP